MKPHAGKARLRPDLERTAREAREKLAAELFNIEALRAAMAKAASGGFLFVTILVPSMLDLRDTPAGRAALAWLHGEGFSAVWDQRRAVDVGRLDEAASDLVVSWSKAPA